MILLLDRSGHRPPLQWIGGGQRPGSLTVHLVIQFKKMKYAIAIALLLVQAAIPQTPSVYFCPMHPDVTSNAAGQCIKCSMALVLGDPWNEREYLVDIQTTPAAPKAGVPLRFRINILDPDSRKPVNDFAVVHDKRYHLFVVSQNLKHFAHIHPEQQSDGSWTIDHTLPEPGYYRIYSDFMPVGGTPQILARTLVTAGYDGDLVSSMATIVPDRSLTRENEDMTVKLTVEPSTIVAGRVVKLRYDLSSNGRPVTDLEPYLAAWGHTLVLSEDAVEYVHAHPIEYLPNDVLEPHGGPTVTFDALFPKPGKYRLWTQFLRNGTVTTTTFAVEAVLQSSQ
jgi:hypothetical protein